MVPTKHSSKSSNETSSTPFGPPFDDDDADTILRSSDHVDFYVYRVILSKSSTFFKSMFSLPQPDTSVLQEKSPVIKLTENSRIIATLLTAIYPVVPSLRLATRLVSLDDMMDAFLAARKYDMDVVTQRLIQEFAESEVVQASPVEAFCAAYSHELGEAARVAAKASLKHRMNLDNIGDKLEYTSGPALLRLYKFHRACSAAAATATDTRLTWATDSQAWWGIVQNAPICNCPKNCYEIGLSQAGRRFGHSWNARAPWSDYIMRARNILLEHPCGEAVTHYSVLKPSYDGTTCQVCRSTLFGLPEFACLLGKAVEKRVSNVNLELPF